MLKRWIFILLLTGPFLASAQGNYNILWITCEDISPNLGCYGDTVAVTPNIDRLASEGMLMTNAFATAGVCAPARSSIITGMYPASIGTHHMRTTWETPFDLSYSVVVPPQVKTFTEYLRGAGYHCTNNFKTDYQFEAPFTAWNENGTNAHWRNRPEGKPFFSVFNLEVTHESQIWGRESYELLVDPDSVTVPPYYPDTKEVREDIARNYSNIQVMDKQVGEILQQLEDDGLSDNTIVFFYSDHGGPLPRQKREVHASGIWVPMVIRFPDGTYQGVTNDELVNFADLAPTVLSLADVKIPPYIQGKAFLGESKETDPRKYSVASRDRLDEEYDMSRSVTDGRYIYVKNYYPDKSWYMPLTYREEMDMMQEMLELRDQGALDEVQMRWFLETKPEEELYDLENDPYEIHNLATNVSYGHKLDELRNALVDWQERYGDLGFVPEKEMLEEMWPGYIQPTTENPKIIYDSSSDKVTITCPTNGASIGYKIGDTDSNWQLYTGSVELPEGESIHAKAIRIGFKESGISSFTPRRESIWLNLLEGREEYFTHDTVLMRLEGIAGRLTMDNKILIDEELKSCFDSVALPLDLKIIFNKPNIYRISASLDNDESMIISDSVQFRVIEKEQVEVKGGKSNVFNLNVKKLDIIYSKDHLGSMSIFNMSGEKILEIKLKDEGSSGTTGDAHLVRVSLKAISYISQDISKKK